MTIDHAVRQLAERQRCLVARRQALDLGATKDMIRRWLAGPDWGLATRRVLRLEGSPRDPRQALMAAVLHAGPNAAASHRAAGALWWLPGFWLPCVEVSRQRFGTRPQERPGLHEPRFLPPEHVTVVDDISVTTLGRTLFDLAGDLHPERTKVVLDAALALSPGLLPVLHRMLPELAERGRPGIRTMRGLLELRPPGYIAPASGTEGRLFELAAEASVKLIRQVDVGGSDWIGRVDAKVLPSGKLVECDSARYHTSLTDKQRDARRDADMKAVGFPDVVRIFEEIVWRQPEQAKRMLRQAARP
jgi:hypothetical protein